MASDQDFVEFVADQIDEVCDTSYRGAKLAFLIQDEIEDSEWLTTLITVTEKELPMPKPKKKKKKKKKSKNT